MINFALYKQGIKSNYNLFVIFIGILTLYITMIISMFDPEQASILAEFAKTMPQFMSLVGMSGDSTTLMGFLITYLYGFLFILFPMIVTIILSNKLIASHTDRGSMAYLLSSHNSRTTIALTQMKVLGTFIFGLLLYTTILSIIVSQLTFPGELVIGRFLILNLGLLILHFAIGGICFLASIISNETKVSLLIGAGVPVVFFMIQMLSNMGGKLETLKYFTIFTLFDPKGLINGTTNSYIMVLMLFIIAITLYITSIYIFKKRDLSV